MLLIIWHSRTGAARAMAEAALAGAQDQALLIAAENAQASDLLAAAGYLFICPENLGAMSGAMKEFFDRCYYPLLGQIEGRPYATVIAAGSDGSGAQMQIDRIVTGWRLRRVAPGQIVCLDAQSAAQIMAEKTVPRQYLRAAHDLGAAVAEGIAQGIF